MRRKIWYLAFIAPLLAVPQLPRDRGPFTPGTFAVTGVNLIAMTGDSVVSGATVLVRDGRIVAAGRDVAMPAGTRRIDANGKYLIPGLSDLHTHLYSDDTAIPDSVGAAELGVMLATGVTTARLMIGTPAHLMLRDGVRRGGTPALGCVYRACTPCNHVGDVCGVSAHAMDHRRGQRIEKMQADEI